MTDTTHKVERALVLSGGGARGAYQVGVWQRLQELGWQPDLVCGTSIGSVNGAMIGMGWSAERMATAWASLDRKNAFRIPVWRRMKYRIDTWRGRHPHWPAYLDNQPLQGLLESGIDLERLRDLNPEVLVTGTNVCRAELRYFAGAELSVDHIMASCAIPVFFPWQEIDGELYWDGGIMENTPVLPAIQRGAKEIVVVLLAPLTGDPIPPPRTTREAMAWALDLVTIASANTLRTQLSHQLGMDHQATADAITNRHFVDFGGIRVAVVAPRNASGLKSILDLNPEDARVRIETGYRDACTQLSDFLATPATSAPPA